MSHREHLVKLLASVVDWNTWRGKQQGIDIDLTGADLRNMDLTGVNLRLANMSRADLRGANLAGADLAEAELVGADLRHAILRETKLADANFHAADLGGVDLSEAEARSANFHAACLLGANLQNADFRDSNMHIADLRGADLSGTDFRVGNYRGAIFAPVCRFNAEDLRDEQTYSGTDFRQANLRGVDFSRANLVDAKLAGVDLAGAHLIRADLRGADLQGATLNGAYLNSANLSSADLREANLSEIVATGTLFCDADLRRAIFREAKCFRTDFTDANFEDALLGSASFEHANLTRTNFKGADLEGANLKMSLIVETDFTNTVLSNCRVYGASIWGVILNEAEQSDLIVNDDDQPTITVDNLELAQFIYLMMNNDKIRSIIDTITSKAVLILGRFTPERKAALDLIRDELRQRNYVPILFDWEVPDSRDISETVTLLARMVRFVIADLSDASSIIKELEMIVPAVAVPVLPILKASDRLYAMFRDYWKYDWVLPIQEYQDIDELPVILRNRIIPAAEAKAHELSKRRDQSPLE